MSDAHHDGPVASAEPFDTKPGPGIGGALLSPPAEASPHALPGGPSVSPHDSNQVAAASRPMVDGDAARGADGQAGHRTSRRRIRNADEPTPALVSPVASAAPIAVEPQSLPQLVAEPGSVAATNGTNRASVGAAEATAARSEVAETDAVIRPMRIISIGVDPPAASEPEVELAPSATAAAPVVADAVVAPITAPTNKDGPAQGEEIESLTDDDLEAERTSDPGILEEIAVEPASKKKPPPPPLKRAPSIDPAPAQPPSPPPMAAVPSIASSTTAFSPDIAEPARKRTKPWWEELFSDDFLRTMGRSERSAIVHECNFIEERLGLEKGAIILDVGCGAGEHAVELAARGYNVVGYDLSLAMLARAQDEAEEHGQKLNFLQGDMREMAFEDAFDGIYCWSTTFGYFDDEKNVNVLSRIRRGLRQGGLLLLDVANRDYVSPRQPSSVWFEGEGCVCMDEMVVDFFTSRLRVKRTVMFEDGRARECDYSIRLYALHELGKILHDAGFKVVEVTGHPAHPGVFFGAESPRVIVLAERS